MAPSWSLTRRGLRNRTAELRIDWMEALRNTPAWRRLVPKGIVGVFVPASLQELVGTDPSQRRAVITPLKGALGNPFEPAPSINVR